MKINIRLFATGLLVLLCCFAVPAPASHIPCPPCHSGDWPDCDWDCSSGESCCGTFVMRPWYWYWDWDCCGEVCCLEGYGGCHECCEDSDCSDPNCWNCSADQCEWACESGEMCCGGNECCTINSCCGDTCCNATQYCCGDPLWNEVCCNANEICCSGLDPNFEPIYYCNSECCDESDCDGVEGCVECVDGSCVAGTVTPISSGADLDLCIIGGGKLIEKPDYTPSSNGCGPAFWGFLVVENPAGCSDTSFTEPCNTHDECYGTCGTDKYNDCDIEFLNDMMDVCDDSSCQVACEWWAETYAGAVAGEWGDEPYENGQVAGCVCCTEAD